jgi:hypothetical protein
MFFYCGKPKLSTSLASPLIPTIPSPSQIFTMIPKDPFKTGCTYHVYSKAIAFENIFKNKGNYTYFLKMLHLRLNGFVVLKDHYFLPNEFHLLVEVTYEHVDSSVLHDVVLQKFANFLNGYVKALNKQYRRCGRLFAHTLGRVQCDRLPVQEYLTPDEPQKEMTHQTWLKPIKNETNFTTFFTNLVGMKHIRLAIILVLALNFGLHGQTSKDLLKTALINSTAPDTFLLRDSALCMISGDFDTDSIILNDLNKKGIITTADVAYMKKQLSSSAKFVWNGDSIRNATVVNSKVTPSKGLSSKKAAKAWGKYFGVHKKGYYEVSKPIYSTDGNMAIVYVAFHCGVQCGNGGATLYKKENGVWKPVRNLNSWTKQ